MYRKADLADLDCIYDALRGLEQYAKQYSWTNSVDFEKAYLTVWAEVLAGKAYVVEGYLVMTDVVTPWYSTDKVLQEWLVLKLYKKGSIGSVPVALLAIAKELGCKSVISADSSPVNIVGRAYEKAGYTPLTRSFTKGINDGVYQTGGS